MFSGLLMALGIIGVGRDVANDIKVNKEIDRVGGYPSLMGCKTVEDFIMKKCINNQVFKKGERNHIPFTEYELETMRSWARSGRHYNNMVDVCYKDETGESMYDAIYGEENKKIVEKLCKMGYLQCMKECHPDKWESLVYKLGKYEYTEEELEEARNDPTNTFANKYYRSK